MARRSDLEIVVDWLKCTPDSSASEAAIVKALSTVHRRLTAERVHEVVTQGDLDEDFPLHRYRNTVLYTGNDAPGLYNNVKRVVQNYWSPDNGFREIEVVVTARTGVRGNGAWTHPDLVMRAYPKRRPSAEMSHDLHALEVEHANGLDVRSVYQAYEQARGADFAWVFGRPDVGLDQDRLVRAAQELGVGLVFFTKAQSVNTWTTVLTAERQPHLGRNGAPQGPAQRSERHEAFRRQVGLRLTAELIAGP